MLNIFMVVAYRGYEVYFYNGAFIRHNETMFIVIPSALAVLLQSKIRIVKLFGIILSLIVFYGVTVNFINSKVNFSHWSNYLYKEQCQCVARYHTKASQEWTCHPSHPKVIISRISQARHLNLSFVNNTYKKCMVSY